jgi:hypothetical protein
MLAAYALAITNLYSDVPDVELDEDEHPRPLRLRFAADARDQFEEWERNLQRELRGLSTDEEDSGLYLGWLSKLAGQTARIAAALHVSTYWTKGAVASQTIDGPTVRGAIKLACYYRLHAQAAFGLMGQLPDQRRAVTILRWLRTRTDKELDGLTVRDVHRTRTKGTTAEQVRAALALLEKHGYLRIDRVRVAKASRGPATEVVRVNPELRRNLRDSPDKPDEFQREPAGSFKPVGSVGRSPRNTAEADDDRGPPILGDPDYLAFVAGVHRNGQITTAEALDLERLHNLIEKATAAKRGGGEEER